MKRRLRIPSVTIFQDTPNRNLELGHKKIKTLPESCVSTERSTVSSPSGNKVSTDPEEASCSGRKKEVLQFFCLDIVKHHSDLVLIGRTKHESCCVRIKNTKRTVYVLSNELHSYIPSIEDHHVYKDFKKLASASGVDEFTCVLDKILICTTFHTLPELKFCLKVEYPANGPVLSCNMKSSFINKVIEPNERFLDNFVLSKGIKGPVWLVADNIRPVKDPITWCNKEACVDSVNDISIVKDFPSEPAELTMAILHVTYFQKNISSASIMFYRVRNIEDFYYELREKFTVISKLTCEMLPDTVEKIPDVLVVPNESMLLDILIEKIRKGDPDIVVGHDLRNLHLPRILHKSGLFKHLNKSQLCRFRDPIMCHRDILPGRIICDIKTAANELAATLRGNDLPELAEHFLGIPLSYGSIDRTPTLLELAKACEKNVQNIFHIFLEMGPLPVYFQLARISGTPLQRTMNGYFSERINYLLGHAFTENNIVVEKKRRPYTKKSSYVGGEVLTPKTGFYDTCVLLLDFEALYCTLIANLDICITRPLPDRVMFVDKKARTGIISNQANLLLETRQRLKLLAENEKDRNKKIGFQNREMAIKLLANGMYGCFGSTYFPYYDVKMASFVAAAGREILYNSINTVKLLGYEILYGDTDSLMIDVGYKNLNEATEISSQIKKKIEGTCNYLNLKLDAVMEFLILFKQKKKYIGMQVQQDNIGKLSRVLLLRGMDFTRNSYSKLADEVCREVLRLLFTDHPFSERIEKIENYIQDTRQFICNGEVPLSKYILRTKLGKMVTDYNEKSSSVFLRVAKRWSNYIGFPLKKGDFIAYVICKDGSNNPAWKRAYRPQEMMTMPSLSVDTYNQLYIPLAGIADSVPVLDPVELSDWLGVKSSQQMPNADSYHGCCKVRT